MSNPFTGGRVIVVGTLNVDHVWRVPALPKPGETILAEEAIRKWGGKGANQAVAAARQGATVAMIGAVGADDEGDEYRAYLQRERITTSSLRVVPGMPTGAAHVHVNSDGENQIVVARGANERLDAAHVRLALENLAPADVLVVQLECPLEAAVEALRWGGRSGTRIVLNASPVNLRFSWGESQIDTVIVNQHECEGFFRHTPAALARLREPERERLLNELAVRHIIVTRGSEATLHVFADAVQTVPTYPVEPMDTVGAGDTFAGALAAQLVSDVPWEDAIWHANVAAALSTLTPGAQAGIPSYADVTAAVQNHRGGSRLASAPVND